MNIVGSALIHEELVAKNHVATAKTTLDTSSKHSSSSLGAKIFKTNADFMLRIHPTVRRNGNSRLIFLLNVLTLVTGSKKNSWRNVLERADDLMNLAEKGQSKISDFIKNYTFR